MSDLSDAFLSKARESLEGATSELVNGRYNNAANRAYYACFQAAIAAGARSIRPNCARRSRTRRLSGNKPIIAPRG